MNEDRKFWKETVQAPPDVWQPLQGGQLFRFCRGSGHRHRRTGQVVQALPQTATQIDLTAQSLYTLSDQTRRIAASLDTDVNLYLLALRGNEDDTISRLLQSYAELNSHIHVSNVDPTEQPTFLDTYDLDINQLYANSVLVDGGGRSRLVSYSDIYVTDYSMNYSTYQYDTSTSFDGENALTNAIHYVSSQNLPKVY